MSVSGRWLAGGSQAFLKLLLRPVYIPSSEGWSIDGEPWTLCVCVGGGAAFSGAISLSQGRAVILRRQLEESVNRKEGRPGFSSQNHLCRADV